MTIYFSVVCLALFVTALPALAQDDAAVARTAAGCGPSAGMFNVQTTDAKHPVSQPEAGKGVPGCEPVSGEGSTGRRTFGGEVKRRA